MLYIKVLSSTDVLLSAEAIQDPVFVMWQTRNSILLSCAQTKAQGIVSNDGSIVYQLDGKPALSQGAEPDMKAIIIDEAEYDDCVRALGDLEQDPSENDPDNTGQEETTQPMNAAQMRAKITAMESTIKELSERNDFLEECLMEMSEVVYA